MPSSKIETAKKPERVDYQFKMSQMLIKNKIGIGANGKLSDKDLKQIQELMAKQKKPAEFFIDFDGEWFEFTVKVGRKQAWSTSIKIAEDRSIKDIDKVLDRLVTYGAANRRQVEKYKKKHPKKK